MLIERHTIGPSGDYAPHVLSSKNPRRNENPTMRSRCSGKVWSDLEHPNGRVHELAGDVLELIRVSFRYCDANALLFW